MATSTSRKTVPGITGEPVAVNLLSMEALMPMPVR
jgi:hypothetical protein